MPHTHDNVACSSIDDARCSCAWALALATGFPITCRRLGFRSGCCKYVEQCKTAIYWDLALDFTLVRLAAFRRWLKTDRLLFSIFFQTLKLNGCTLLHATLHCPSQVNIRTVALYFFSKNLAMNKNKKNSSNLADSWKMNQMCMNPDNWYLSKF